MKEKTFNKIFNYFILGGMALCVILATASKIKQPDARVTMLILTAFGALMGVASTVLAANGNILNFIFGLIDVCIYSYALYDSKMPAQFLLHVLYFIPMEFVGIFQWRKRGAAGNSKVKAQRIKGKKWIWYSLLFAAVYAAAFALSWFVLRSQGESAVWSKISLDALVTTANIVALVMMAFAYMEQWFIWTIVNLASVCIWSYTLASSPEAGYAIIPLVKYFFYFLNGLNGIRIWWGLSKE